MWPELVVKCEAKRSIADYAHRRPKLVQRREMGGSCPPEKMDRHRQHSYYGLRTTNVTRHLGCHPPSHAYSPALLHVPPPSFHRKSSSITENVLGAVHVKRFDPSLPAPWHNRQATDVTDQLRFLPPAHAMASSTHADPWYGRARTYVTNPDVDDYSNYGGRMTAPKVPEPQQANLKEEVCKGDEDHEEPEQNWEWNNGHKLYCLENGGRQFSQNWSSDEMEICN